MSDLRDYPPGLQVLIGKLIEAIHDLVTDLEEGDLDADAWQQGMADLLARYSLAAYMTGSGTRAIDAAGMQVVSMLVKTQLAFLDNFTLVIQSEDAFIQGWYARAEMYARSIVTPYWKGRTKLLPLPAMPGEGSQCLNNCRCGWDIRTVDEDAGDYDCYWRLRPADHCQTCVERARQWNPLKIRKGRLVIADLEATE